MNRVRSPLVTAVATSAMARTWVVRLAASWFTLSVRSRHRPAAPGTRACPPSLPSTPTSRATAPAEFPLTPPPGGRVRDLIGEGGERVDHPVDRVGERRDLALGVHG